jgi:hypothetical protein
MASRRIAQRSAICPLAARVSCRRLAFQCPLFVSLCTTAQSRAPGCLLPSTRFHPRSQAWQQARLLARTAASATALARPVALKHSDCSSGCPLQLRCHSTARKRWASVVRRSTLLQSPPTERLPRLHFMCPAPRQTPLACLCHHCHHCHHCHLSPRPEYPPRGFALPTANCQLPTANRQPPSPGPSPLTTHHSPLTTHQSTWMPTTDTSSRHPHTCLTHQAIPGV